MKPSTRLGIAAVGLFVALALPVKTIAQQSPNAANERSGKTRYTVVDLGPVGPVGQPFMISKNGLIAGFTAAPDGTSYHATLWFHTPQGVDIGTPGLGGPNSFSFGVNERGEAVGSAQTSSPDPDIPAEDFCGFNAFGFTPSNSTCLPYVWRHGTMRPLPTLGGPNGFAWMINDRGEIAGLAETGANYGGGCPVHQFVPTVWKHGRPTALDTPGELYGVAAYLNDKGQVVGAAGPCVAFNPYSLLYLSEEHAMLWDEDGTPHELPSLGGAPSQGGPAAVAGNHACSINNRGQAVGHSELPNGTTYHAVLWPTVNSNLDLGTLPAPLNYSSLALGINDRSQVVGASFDPTQTISRAFIWQNGVMTDLNHLVKGHPGLTLTLAESVNNRGEIIGIGLTSTSEAHGFLAIPSDDTDKR